MHWTLLFMLGFYLIIGDSCENSKSANNNWRTEKDLQYLLNYTVNHIDEDSLLEIDKNTGLFCICFDEKKSEIPNPFQRFNHCATDNLDFGFSSFYDPLIFASVYLKNDTAFYYFDALFMTEDELPLTWEKNKRIDHEEIEFWLCADIRRVLNLPIDSYIIESRSIMRRPW